jgi:uncharacterized membrane protein
MVETESSGVERPRGVARVCIRSRRSPRDSSLPVTLQVDASTVSRSSSASPWTPLAAWRLSAFDVASSAVIVAFVVLWGGFNATNLRAYNFTHATQDQAIFLQVLHSILHHGSFSESIYHSGSTLGSHFSPVYLLLAPLALVLPGIWLVALFPLLPVLASSLVARSMARRATGSRGLALLVLVAGLFNPLTVHLAEQGLRETLVAALFLALALDAFERRREASFVVFCVLASLCKEDIPLVVVGFLLPALVDRRRGFWIWFPPIYGIVAFALIVQVLLPRWGATHGQGGFGFPFFEAMGASYAEVALYVLTHPVEILLRMLDRSNLIFFQKFLGSFWYLPLVSPALLLVPFSQYLEIGLSASRHVAEIHNWYYAPAYPFLVAAFAHAVGRVDRIARRAAERTQARRPSSAGRAVVTAALATALIASYAVTVGNAVAAPLCFRGVVRHQPEAGAAVRIHLYLYYLRHLAFFRQWSERIDRPLNRISTNAAVSAQYPFLIALAWRDHVTLFPDVDPADFAVLHRSLAAYPFRDHGELREATWNLPQQGFRLAESHGGLMIFGRAQRTSSDPATAANDDGCLERCWRYEAEELPPVVPGRETPGVCSARTQVDRGASGLAARASSLGNPLPIGRWVLELEPGRHTVSFQIRVRKGISQSGYLLRMVAIDDDTGKELASRALQPEQTATENLYRRHDLVVLVPCPANRRAEIHVEDPHRASFLIDTVEVRHDRSRACDGASAVPP